MEQKIVVHTKKGSIHKGVTHDFEPGIEAFHFLPAEGGGVPMRLMVEDVKAVFWVRDYIGNRHFVARRRFPEQAEGKRAIVTFSDGEEVWGTLDDSDAGKMGFFLTPSDREDNNVRIYVVRSALKDLRVV